MRAKRYVFGLLLAFLASACTDPQLPTSGADDPSPPSRGGTLKVVGFSDVDHLASVGAYSTSSLALLWTFTRQLVTYPLHEDFATAAKVVPDLAETLPTFENGGISADGRSYTFHLRRGVRRDWAAWRGVQRRFGCLPHQVPRRWHSPMDATHRF